MHTWIAYPDARKLMIDFFYLTSLSLNPMKRSVPDIIQCVFRAFVLLNY